MTKDNLVHNFARKWLAKFKDTAATERSVVEGFAEDCYALDFKEDCRETFNEVFPDASKSVRDLQAIIDQVNDAPLLGSAIFSQWMYVTHRSKGESLLDDHYRSWFIVALEQLYRISDDSVDSHPVIVFRGTPAKMRLISNGECYGPRPEPDDEVEQRLVINSTGVVSLSRYLFGEGQGNHPIRKCTQRQRIPAENAAYLLKRIGDHFSDGNELMFATDVGSWELILTNTDGESFKYSGSLISDKGGFFDQISETIRVNLDMPDLYAFDGAYAEDRVERIELDYHRVRKFIPNAPIAPGLKYTVWDYRERLSINRADDTIEYFQKIAEQCDVLRRYHVQEGVSSFLDDLDVDTIFSEFHEVHPDAVEDPMDLNEYTLKVHFMYGPMKEITGVYDREGLPTDWPRFMDDLADFLDFYAGGDIMASSVYAARRRRSSDLMYCSVEFEPEGKTYYYISNDTSINEDDMVEVPVGVDNNVSTARVVAIEFFSRDDAPFPPDKVKRIIRKIDRR